MWWMCIAFECGISPREFKKCRIGDIQEIMQIKSAVGMKKQRNQKVQDLMNKVRFN